MNTKDIKTGYRVRYNWGNKIKIGIVASNDIQFETLVLIDPQDFNRVIYVKYTDIYQYFKTPMIVLELKNGDKSLNKISFCEKFITNENNYSVIGKAIQRLLSIPLKVLSKNLNNIKVESKLYPASWERIQNN